MCRWNNNNENKNCVVEERFDLESRAASMVLISTLININEKLEDGKECM